MLLKNKILLMNLVKNSFKKLANILFFKIFKKMIFYLNKIL